MGDSDRPELRFAAMEPGATPEWTGGANLARALYISLISDSFSASRSLRSRISATT